MSMPPTVVPEIKPMLGIISGVIFASFRASSRAIIPIKAVRVVIALSLIFISLRISSSLILTSPTGNSLCSVLR